MYEQAIYELYKSLSLSFFFKKHFYGQPGWLSSFALPSAQGVILETWIESRIRLPAWSLLFPLLASPSACVSASFSLRVSHE